MVQLLIDRHINRYSNFLLTQFVEYKVWAKLFETNINILVYVGTKCEKGLRLSFGIVSLLKNFAPTKYCLLTFNDESLILIYILNVFLFNYHY